MKAIQLKYIAVAGLLVLGLANHSFAANAAEAAGVMADLESLVVQAKAALAKASLKGVDAIAEPLERSVAIDDSVEAGKKALAAMEQAIAKGDDIAAEAAEDKLAEALGQARDALAGILPVAVETSPTEKPKKPKNSNKPNIYDVPWKSQGIRAYYEELFGSFHDASGFGQGRGFGDRDATPE